MHVTIEPVATLCLAEIEPLVAESERAGWRLVRRLVDEWSAGQNRFDQPVEALLAARHGAELVGICGLNIDPYAADEAIGRVRHLYVAAGWRRRGVGGELVERIVQLSRARFRELRLRTRNPDAARLYERLGFQLRTDIPESSHVLRL